MEFTFGAGAGMLTLLAGTIVISGSIVALVFRRMVLRNEKRERELRQSH